MTDSDEEEFEKKWRDNENNLGNLTGFKKVSSVSALSTGSPFKGKAGKGDEYSRAVSNLD